MSLLQNIYWYKPHEEWNEHSIWSLFKQLSSGIWLASGPPRCLYTHLLLNTTTYCSSLTFRKVHNKEFVWQTVFKWACSMIPTSNQHSVHLFLHLKRRVADFLFNKASAHQLLYLEISHGEIEEKFKVPLISILSLYILSKPHFLHIVDMLTWYLNKHKCFYNTHVRWFNFRLGFGEF